jgi:DNA replication protein DnaC
MDEKSVRFIRNLVSHNGVPAGPAIPKDVGAKPQDFGSACPVCGGSGWKTVPGVDRRVARCDCFFRDQGSRLLELSGIPARHKSSDFSNYGTDSSRSLEGAKIKMQKWAEQYPLDQTGLLIVGPSGVGKTHLAVAIIKELMIKGVQCLFSDYRELLKEIQNSYNPSVQTSELQILRPVFEAEVLVLDDLGAVKPSAWVWDTVSIVLNTRYNDKRTTIITTNVEDGPAKNPRLSATDAAAREDTLGDRIGERMRSRLFEMCRLIQMDGKDFRHKLRTASFR